MTIVGAIFASFCLFISKYAKSVYILYLTIGIGTGVGLGFIYLAAMITLTSYFDKKRGLATGIAVCGTGLGTTVLPYIISQALKHFNWQGSMVTLAVIVLLCMVLGLAFRPVKLLSPSQTVLVNEDKVR